MSAAKPHHDGSPAMPEERGRPDALVLLAALGLGATAMYFLDPERGRRRRRVTTDRFVHIGHLAADAAGTTTRDLGNRAVGVASLARRPFTHDAAEDAVIADRVRTELGRVASRPGAIDVSVEDAFVTVSGPVLAADAEDLLNAVGDVRGVIGVNDQLQRHETGDVPALQRGGDGRPASSRFEFLQESWSPAARLLATTTGLVLVAANNGGRRRTPVGMVAGLAGAALALRAATNLPFDRLFGVGAGRRAIDVQKSINIAAPIDDVFVWLTAWERWPAWMSHVRQVHRIAARDGGREWTHWVVDGPAGIAVEWDAVTTRLEHPSTIAWKTAQGSRVAHEGTIRLVATDEGHTRVDVRLTYNPIVGAAGHAVARLFKRDPKRQLEDDLARLKMTIETGRAPHDAARPGADAAHSTA